jgi:signal transduction histidine kinase
MKLSSLKFNQRYARALRAYVVSEENRGHLPRRVALLPAGPRAQPPDLARVHAAVRAESIPETSLSAERKAFARRAADFLHHALADQFTRQAAPPCAPPGAGMAARLRLSSEISRRQTAEAALRDSRKEQSVLLAEALQMQHQLRQLAHKVIRAQEEERKEISRELHDEIVQTLAGINVQLAVLKIESASNGRNARRNIDRTQRLVRQSVRIVYRFARELRPTLLDDLGLVAALHNFVQGLTKRTGIAVRMQMSGPLARLPDDFRIVVFRVTQAALANVAQHSAASRARVAIRWRRGQLHLAISDNGTSFNAPEAMRPHRKQRLGLVGMRERVEMLNGRFQIDSAPGHGTTVRAAIPCPTPKRTPSS